MLDSTALNRLKWRSRRGLLENDLFIERFFERHGATLTERQAIALNALMELADNDLLDLLLGRSEPDGTVDSPDVRDVLTLMKVAPANFAAQRANAGMRCTPDSMIERH